MHKADISGQRFGRLSVVRCAGSKSGRLAWLCRCECGAEKEIVGMNLRRGRVKSCGCLQRENKFGRVASNG